jgi:hypothetical protein
VVRGTLAVVVLLVLLGVGPASAAEKTPYPVSFHAFAFSSGTTTGTRVDTAGALVLDANGLTTVSYDVDDPASPDDASVRHVYDRAQFEEAWMTASGGIVYVIHPSSVPLPPSPADNW